MNTHDLGIRQETLGHDATCAQFIPSNQHPHVRTILCEICVVLRGVSVRACNEDLRGFTSGFFRGAITTANDDKCLISVGTIFL
jgi:hypothetical protein